MPAANGTPTIWEKLVAPFHLGPNWQETLAGDQRDLTAADTSVMALFAPILNNAETEGLADLSTFLKALLGALPTVTSVSQAVGVVNAALAAEAGPLQKQAVSLGQSSVITLISAALAAVGKVNLPLVG